MDILAVITFLLVFCKHSLVLCDEGTDRYVSYQGFGDLVLACSGSDVINITGFDLTNHATSCPHQTCALSENDSLFIENCNDNSTCTIPVHNMSGCITEKGFYNLRYSCKTKALTCDFDHNRCNIRNIQGAWTVDNASRAGGGYRDHTLGEEYGRMLYIINGQSGETKITNRVSSSPIQCLSFWYWGNNLVFLAVYREHRDGFIDGIDRFPNANRYTKFMRNLTDIGDYYLRFKATGSSGSSKFLIDDITIVNADCDESRDHIQYNQTCRRVDDVTELQGCSIYYIENVISHLDPMKETCHNLFDDGHICDVSSDPSHCDATQLAERYPSCFNINTLMINYTCTRPWDVRAGVSLHAILSPKYTSKNIISSKLHEGETAQKRKDSVNIGLVAGAGSGGLLVWLTGVVLFILCGYHKRKDKSQAAMHNQSVSSHSTMQGTSSQTQPTGRETICPLNHYTDISQSTSEQEHKYMTISTAYETIAEKSNDYINNPYSSQLCDNYTTLDSTRIETPNVYDNLASPCYTNMNEVANESGYEEQVHGK